jgi:DNA mismatch endonuclease (patch repair protein)
MGLNELADIFDKKTRSKIMSRVKGKNTKPELQVRSLLHRAGFRFRLSSKNVPGKPDIVLPKYKVVVLVHGCFWHGHDCYRFSWPKTRKAFWRKKIEGNRERDTRYLQELN